MEPIKSSICRSCRLRLAGQPKPRSFSTTTSRRVVPPESPYYVDIPSSYQPYLPYTKQQKGTLPVPRELFPASRPDKPSKEYLDNVTRDVLEKNKLPAHKLTQVGKHKVKMAEVRKSQLREGLTGLYTRKQTELQSMAKRSQAKQLQRDQLLKQAEREDARLTNVSTQQEMNADTSTSASIAALEAEIAVAKRMHETKLANLARITAQKHEEKMDSLHTLYMNARHFITTEEQLNDLIHKQFDTDTVTDRYDPYEPKTIMHADFRTSIGDGTSMWNFGPPDGVKNMIGAAFPGAKERTMADAMTRKQGESKADKARFTKEQTRMKRIAEKLSGGKI